MTVIVTKLCDGQTLGRWSQHGAGQRERFSGGLVDQRLKDMMKELGEAINESLSDSEPISRVVSQIKEGGYDVFLVLEATIGVSKQGEVAGTPQDSDPEFAINDHDVKFLKSLRIRIDGEESSD